MQIPLTITYRHMTHSEALDAHIQGEAQKLEKFFERITRCRVTIEQPHLHRAKGRHFRVLVDVTMPGKEIVVGRDPAEHFQFEDPYMAVSESFAEVRRQMQDAARRRKARAERGRVSPLRGMVSRLEGDHGFIQTEDGREIYFHQNSVLNGGFEKMEVGAKVRFQEEQGDNGPQASTVAVSSKAKRPAA